MGLLEKLISNKLYEVLYLDILINYLWSTIIELWEIGGSAIEGVIVLFLLMMVLIIAPWIPLLIFLYSLYKLLECFINQSQHFLHLGF